LYKIYYTILLFVCLTAKPICTIGYVGYYKLNIEYIVDKYCVNKSKPILKCNGKCHLVKKISFASDMDSKNTQKTVFGSLSEAFFPVFFQKSNFELQLIEHKLLKKLNFFKAEEDYIVSLSISLPPPRC